MPYRWDDERSRLSVERCRSNIFLCSDLCRVGYLPGVNTARTAWPVTYPPPPSQSPWRPPTAPSVQTPIDLTRRERTRYGAHSIPPLLLLPRPSTSPPRRSASSVGLRSPCPLDQPFVQVPNHRDEASESQPAPRRGVGVAGRAGTCSEIRSGQRVRTSITDPFYQFSAAGPPR